MSHDGLTVGAAEPEAMGGGEVRIFVLHTGFVEALELATVNLMQNVPL